MNILGNLTRQQILDVLIEVYNDRENWGDAQVQDVINHIKEQILSLASNIEQV